ncbi:MAG: ATP-binding protein [Planctomycetaceae bacterium]
MITRIEALNFRCLRYISQPLDRFHVLVGPNASGKTTFLDVVAFIGRVVSDGLDAALEERSPNLQDQVFGRKGTSFELAVQVRLPDHLVERIVSKQADYVEARPEYYATLEYRLAVGFNRTSQENEITWESLDFVSSAQQRVHMTTRECENQDTLASQPIESEQDESDDYRRVIGRTTDETLYNMEDLDFFMGRTLAFQLPKDKTALSNMPDDELKFSAGMWLKKLLKDAVHRVVLDSQKMRLASPPGQGRNFKPDGSNLPWVIEDLYTKSPEAFRDWIDHLKTALPDLVGIRTVERPDDKHRYLMLQYQGGIEVPSWTVSDGTLRLLALTLLAYLPNLEGIYLIEEPENGIHPKAVETMFQSLSNVYGAQILLATHSPVILSMTNPKDILCFTKDEEGATNIVSGDQHPALLHWQHETSLGDLFAAGVLG